MSWFSRSTTLDPSDATAQLGAYKEGRRDERLQAEADAPDRRRVKTELAEAHDRGRREERLRRRGSPLGALFSVMMFLLAAVAVVTIVLAARYGSFAAAGQVIDTVLTAIFQPSAS